VMPTRASSRHKRLHRRYITHAIMMPAWRYWRNTLPRDYLLRHARRREHRAA